MASHNTKKTGLSLRPVEPYRTKPSLQTALASSLAILLTLAYSAGTPAAEPETDTAHYRTTLLELFDTAGEILFVADPNSAEAIAASVDQLDQVTEEQFQTVFIESLPQEQLDQHLLDLAPHLAAVRNLDEMDGIDIPTITVEPSECESANPGVALGAQTVASIFEIIVGSQKFICLQEVLGENFALACTAFDIVRATASSVAQGENFCLAQKNLARNKAMLDLTQGIGEHLNTFVDETTLTSRASQDALDAAQNDFNDIQSDTQDIQSSLDSGYAQLDAQTSALTMAIADLGNDLNGLASLLNDISFRSTVNLAFLDDASERVADLQERASDIQTDVETILTMVGSANETGSQLSTVLQNEWTRQQRDRIAADLGNTNANNPGHALPSSAGGELELAREIVINAIFGLQALGGVDTSEALSLVGAADDSYNTGQYAKAYLTLKQAYQSLDGLKEAR